MANISINLGSFALNSTNGLSLDAISAQVAKTVQEYALPKFHGSIIPIGKRKSLSLNFSGVCSGSNYTDTRTKMDALKAALESTSEIALTLADDRQISVQYKNFSEKIINMQTYWPFSFDVIASYPFWVSQTLTSDTPSWTNGVAFNITNNGNATARAKVSITAPGAAIIDDIRLVNNTQGQTFQYRGTVNSSKVLIVDNLVEVTDLTVTNDGTDDITNFEGDFIDLAPGINSLVLYSGSGGATLNIKHRDTYY